MFMDDYMSLQYCFVKAASSNGLFEKWAVAVVSLAEYVTAIMHILWKVDYNCDFLFQKYSSFYILILKAVLE